MSREVKLQAIRKDTKERFDVLCIDWMHSCVFLGGMMCDIQMDKVDLIQWTGLTDVNGTEIYDGDIVSHKGSGKIPPGDYEVVYSEKAARFGVRIMNNSTRWQGRYSKLYSIIGCKVIGNIHESKGE